LNNVIASTVNSSVILGTSATIAGINGTSGVITNLNSSGTATINRMIITTADIGTANIGVLNASGALSLGSSLQVATTLRVIGESVFDKSLTINEELKFASLNGTIKTGSTDGADNRSISIAGASVGATRGSSVTVYGNEHANVGSTVVQLGNNAGAYFKVINGAGVDAVRIDGLNNSIYIGTANIGVLNTTVNISSLTTTTVNASRVSGNNVIANRLDAITVSFNDFIANGTSTMNILKASGAITGASYSGGAITGTTINASSIISSSALQINGNSIFTGYGNFGGVLSSVGTMNYSATTRNATVSTGNIDIPIIIKGITYYLKATQ
jgi:hypothetical protein